MYIYHFSKLTGENLIQFQGASFEQAGQPVKVSNAEAGQIFPAEGAMNLSNFMLAPHSQNLSVLGSFVDSLNLNKFISFNNRTIV